MDPIASIGADDVAGLDELGHSGCVAVRTDTRVPQLVLNAMIVAAAETDAFRPAANSPAIGCKHASLAGGPRLANPSSAIAVGFVGEAAL